MIAKLPTWLINRWARRVAEYQQKRKVFPRFKYFVDFVASESNITSNPITSVAGLHDDSRSRDQKSAHVLATGAVQATPPDPVSTETGQVKSSDQKQWPPCVCCSQQHSLQKCAAFIALAGDQKQELIKKHRLCYLCLKPGHRKVDCRLTPKCGYCSKPHLTIMHDAGPIRSKPQERDTGQGEHQPPPWDLSSRRVTYNAVSPHNQTPINYINCGTSLKSERTSTCASTLILPVYLASQRNPGTEVLTYAMLDTQSDTSFVLESTAAALGVTGVTVPLKLSTLTSDKEVLNCQRLVKLTARAYNGRELVELPPLYSRPTMPCNRSHIPTDKTVNAWPHLRRLQGKVPPLLDCEVGLLIGYDCAAALAPLEIVSSPRASLHCAYRTRLGWGIIGPAGSTDFTADLYSHTAVCHRVVSETLVSAHTASCVTCTHSEYPPPHRSYTDQPKRAVPLPHRDKPAASKGPWSRLHRFVATARTAFCRRRSRTSPLLRTLAAADLEDDPAACSAGQDFGLVESRCEPL